MRASRPAVRSRFALELLGLLLVAPRIAAAAGAAAPDVVWVSLGGETFTLEVAADPESRHRGLSGRAPIPPYAGMLFVMPQAQEQAMVMRDCPVAIDVAFLDEEGRVVAVREMKPEPPRGPHEGLESYEARLPVYASGAPARFAIETAGGRLRAVGLTVGDRVALDTAALLARLRARPGI
jgi:uncharacterized membrane protein (UPF0127 family)